MATETIALMGRALTIDGTVIGNTSLGVPDSDGVVGLWVVFQLLSTTALVIPPTVSIGVTAAAYTDIMPATALTTLTTAGQGLNVYLTAVKPTGVANSEIFLRVNPAAVATAYNFAVLLFGTRGNI